MRVAAVREYAFGTDLFQYTMSFTVDGALAADLATEGGELRILDHMLDQFLGWAEQVKHADEIHIVVKTGEDQSGQPITKDYWLARVQP